MHELSVVLNIISIAENEAALAGANKIKAIEVEIGELSSIEPAAFDFAWNQGIRGTMLENAEHSIRYVHGKATCRSCGETFRLRHLYDACPGCGGFFPEIIEGRELKVKSITVD